MKNSSKTIRNNKVSNYNFLYSMGLKEPENNNDGIVSAMDFAQAMGVERYIKARPETKSEVVTGMVPARLKMI